MIRVVITDTSDIWKYDDPMFEKFKYILLIVCLNGKAVTNKYECFVSPYNETEDIVGFESHKFKALQSVAKELNSALFHNDDVLFLTDDHPESLYPFYVIQNENKYNNLHLCALSPDKNKKAYYELLSDLSKVTSVLYLNSHQYMNDAR